MKILILLCLLLSGCGDNIDYTARLLKNHKKQVGDSQYTHCINGYEFLENINWSVESIQILDTNKNPKTCDY